MLLSRKFTTPKLRDDSSFISIIKAGLIEMGATALFLFFTIGTITSGCHAKDVAQSSGHPISLAGAEAGSCALNVGNVGNIAFAFGLSIFVLVYATAALTGGHINPAVTLGLLVAGRICALRALVYTLCQMLGAAIGAGLVKAIDPSGFYAAAGGVDKVPHWMAFEAAWGMEAILTFALVFMVFAATDNFHAMTTAHLPVLAPLAIGLTVYLCHLVAVPLDGCSINPARSFGSAIVANQWYSHWVFWVGPYTGAIFAAYVYEAVFKHVDESVSTIQDHSLVIIKAPTDQDLEAGNFKVGGQIGIGGEFPHVAQPGPEQGPGMPAQTVG